MSQPISVSVQMDAASFHDFAAFDLLRHHKAWHLTNRILPKMICQKTNHNQSSDILIVRELEPQQ